MLLHTFYWVTNQYLVQRVIAARSLRDAQIGALTAGFLKLCIPFTCILTGIAAAHLFRARFDQSTPLPDDAFVYLVHAVVPQGVGWTGIIFAGVAASIFSTLDSMLNSATTLLSIDIYQKYFRSTDKGAGETAGDSADNASGETAGDSADDDRHLVRFGRATTLVISLLTAALAYLTYDPSAGGNFFLRVSAYGSYITPGIIAVFFAAVALRGIPGWGAFLAIVSAPLTSFALEWGYEWIGERCDTLQDLFGPRLNFLHRVALSFGSSLLLLLWSRRFGQRDGSHHHDTGGMVLARAQWMALVSITAIFVGMNTIAVLLAMFTPLSAPMLALPMGISTALFLERVLAKRRIEPVVRYLSAILVAVVVFILYYFT
jgi:SSS family solute:Na+ symporter